jgi:hypothetical protein
MHQVTFDEEDDKAEEFDEDGFEDSGDLFDEEVDVEDYLYLYSLNSGVTYS